MSHPDALPDLFLDRSLGRIIVPSLLRAAGLRLTTLAEHYGVPAASTPCISAASSASRSASSRPAEHF